jgi:hypothetical protein
MVVEVHDQEAAAEPMEMGTGGNRDVVQEAKAHPASRFGVVARRPNQGEYRPVTARRGLRGHDDTARRAPGYGERLSVYQGIAGRQVPRFATGVDFALEQVEISPGVDALELFVARVPSCERLPECSAGMQARPDRFHPAGRLGMSGVPEMVAVDRVGDEA